MKRKKNTSKRKFQRKDHRIKILVSESSPSDWNLPETYSRGTHEGIKEGREEREKKRRRVRRTCVREREKDRGGRKVHHTRRSERIPAARVNIEVQGRRKTSPSRGTRVDDYGLIPLYAHSHQPT